MKTVARLRLCIVALVGGLVTAGSAAHAANNVGWVFANQPTNPDMYTPGSQYSFNSTHAAIRILRGETGLYTVYFDNLYLSSAPGNTLISAYNSANFCKSDGYSRSGTTVAVEVECVNSLGQAADTEFSLLVQTRSAPFASGSAGNAIAYLDVPNPSATNAPIENSFNSQGGRNSAAHASTAAIGNISVTLPGLTQQGGNVQVSSMVDGDSNIPCKTVSWSAASKGTTVNVQCHRLDNGRPFYGPFTVAYAIGEPFGLVPGEATLGAWLWANDLTAPAPYRPNAHFQYNGFKTGAMSVQRTSLGHYTVAIPGTLTYSSSVALVSATGTGNDYCTVAGWATNTVSVVCYNQKQAFADSRFNVTFQTAK